MAAHMHSTVFMIALSLFVAGCVYILNITSSIQNGPYMDEIFHVNQTQAYFRGDYKEWNNKITTLPGLYFTSVVILKLLSFPSNYKQDDICTPKTLRAVNVGLLVILVIVINAILRKVEESRKDVSTPKSATTSNKSGAISPLLAIVLGQFPVLFFSSFLYYTDTGSTLAVCISYLYALNNKDTHAALVGAVAVFFRQTNIIWLGFIAGQRVLQQFQCNRTQHALSKFWKELLEFCLYCLTNLKVVLTTTFPYVVLLLSFVMFVFFNGGIVVGDRESHQASLHIPQLFYLSSFMFAFTVPYHLSIVNYRYIISICTSKKAIVYFILLLVTACFIVHYFTYAHIYLLSDNRHYTFYIWMRIIEHHWFIRYALTPFYIIAGGGVALHLAQRQCQLWIFLYVLCVAMVTVPQKLLEFRYFILPYLMYRIHVPLPSWKQLSLEFVLYSIVNVATFYLYLFRPFHWPDSNDWQRFMW